jgi:hypothetical protein
MKKINLLLIGSLLALIVNAQSNKLSVGIVASPDFYNYDFEPISYLGHHYETKNNYSFGAAFQYSINEKFAVKTGLIYSDKGYVLKFGWIAPDSPFYDPLLPERSVLNANYIDVPLLLNYSFINRKKISLFSSAGIITSFLIGEKEISTMKDGSMKETIFLKNLFDENSNPNLFALNINLGLKYNLNERLFLTLEPYFRYGLNKIDYRVLYTPPTSYGALIGVNYYLR